MKRSSQKQVTDIIRAMGVHVGEKRFTLKKGQEVLSGAYKYFASKGFVLTPYINGDLNLTWSSKEDGGVKFNRLLTSVEEVIDTPDALIKRSSLF